MIAVGDEIPVFSITEALGNRNPKQLRERLESLLMTGTAPLMINKLLSSRIRTLLAAKSILSKQQIANWKSSIEYWNFRKNVLEHLNDVINNNSSWLNVLGGRHPYSLFLAFKEAEKFRSDILRRGLVELAKVDLALKSSVKSPLVMIEMALMPLCA